MKLGAKVVYGKGENIHVSGHGFQEDQKLMLALAKPKFLFLFMENIECLFVMARVHKLWGFQRTIF